MRERVRNALPYALVILLGLSCVLAIVLTAVGTQRLGWWAGVRLQSDLEADYSLQPEFTLAPVDATRVALLQATDDAGLQLTALPGTLATVSVGLSTPGGTPVAQVTHTSTPSPTASPTKTPSPPPTSTPTPSRTPTRTPTASPVRSPTPLTPTFTASPMPTNTEPAPEPPTDTPTPSVTATPSQTPTPTPTATPSQTPTATATPSQSPTSTATATPSQTPTPTNTPTNPPPPAPAMLSVVNTSTELIGLAWSNESAADLDFVGYNIYSSTTPGGPAYTFVANTGVLTTYVVSGLTNNTTYYFVVRGADAVQESSNSPEASGTTGAIVAPNPTPPPACAPPAPPDCANAGGVPNGSYSSVYPGQAIILDLGAGNGILDGPGYDFVYYERDAGGMPPTIIRMDWVTVELSVDATTWYVAFVWNSGNEALAQNSNIAPFATLSVNSAYCDVFAGATSDEPIPIGACSSWGGLYGVPPTQTGIAIDIGGATGLPPPPGEGYRFIRVQGIDPAQPAEVDAIERLN